MIFFFNWNSLSFSQECLAWFVTRAQFTNFYRETLFIAFIASEFQLMALSLSSEPMVSHRELCLSSMFSNTFGRTHPLLKFRKLGVTMDRSNYTKNVSLCLWQRCRRKFCSFNSIDFVNGWRKFFSFRDCVVKFNFLNSNFCIFRNFQRYINSTFSLKRIISLWVYQILFSRKLTPFLFSNFCMVSRFLSEHSWMSSIVF